MRVGGAVSAAERSAAAPTCPSATCCCPWRDALGNAALALECQGVPRAEARRRAEPLFERFGLAEFERSRPAELSGGMRQRVAFLRTLLPGRPVLLLDEPFGALDAITRADLQEWLAGMLAEEPRTVLLVTHDVEEAVFLADRVIVLSARPGRMVAEFEVALPRPRSVTDPDLARAARARRWRPCAHEVRAERSPARPVRPRLAGRGLARVGRRPHARLAGRDLGRPARRTGRSSGTTPGSRSSRCCSASRSPSWPAWGSRSSCT